MLSLSKLIERWIKPKESQDALGIYLASDSISMVHLHYDEINPIPQVLADRHILCTSDAEKQAAVKEFIAERGIQQPVCHVALAFQEYKITLLDMPPVNANELISSVRWMLKDVINYPADEACVEVFEVPLPRAKDNMKLIYTAVMPFNRVLLFEKMVKEAGGQLGSLGIPEFAIRNVFFCLGVVDKISLIVYVGSDLLGKLIIMNKSAVYMLRNIDLKDNMEESFVLEIQRYLDYSNTLFRKQICEQACILPGKFSQTLHDLFKKNFEIKIETLDDFLSSSQVAVSEKELFQKEHASELIMAIGAGLEHKMKEQKHGF